MTINTDAVATPFVLRWRGWGIIVTAIFGAMWANWARPMLAHTPAIITVLAIVIVTAITGTLLLAGISLLRRGSRLPNAPNNASAAAHRRTRRGFWFVVIGEVVALNIAAYFLIGHGLAGYLPPAIAIVVGLHFFPLARLFRSPHYYATGTLMTLAGIAAILAMLSGRPATLADGLSNLVCALALWSSGVLTWGSAHKALTKRNASASHALMGA